MNKSNRGTLDEFKRVSQKALLGKQAQGHGRQAAEARRTAERIGLMLDGDPRQAANEAMKMLDAAIREVFAPGKLSEVPTENLIDLAEGVAALCLFRDLKTSQIRNFFGHVKRLASQFRNRGFSREEVELLRIPLVYARGRNDAIEPLYRACISALESISDNGDQGKQDFMRFDKLLEAIVAYHKFYGGSE